MNTQISRDGGKPAVRRVTNVGNLVLTVVAFIVSVVLSMAALDQRWSHYFFDGRHRTPPIIQGANAPVVLVNLRAGNSTVTTVPTFGIFGMYDVMQSIATFFSDTLDTSVGSAAAWTLSDFYRFVFLSRPMECDPVPVANQTSRAVSMRAASSSRCSPEALSRRHTNILHFCGATSCVLPYVLQEWSERQARVAGATTTNNFALVFGERQLSRKVMENLDARGIRTARLSLPEGGVATALVGDELFQSPYFLRVKCIQAMGCLYSAGGTVPEQKTEEDENKDFLWNNAIFANFRSIVFDSQYVLGDFPIDVVHLDLDPLQSVAEYVYLRTLANDDHRKRGSMPSHIVMTLYSSAWLDNLVRVLGLLELKLGYALIPLSGPCLTEESLFPIGATATAENLIQWVRARDTRVANSPSFGGQRNARQSLCRLLLSRVYHRLEDILQQAETRRQEYSDAAPLDRLFSFSCSNSTRTTDMDVEIPQSAARPVLPHMVYFLLSMPLLVVAVLLRSLCRRRRSR